MGNPNVCISILNWIKYEDTIACIQSIKKNTVYDNYKIVVVDNHSVNDSVKIIQSAFPEITIICSDQNLGYAGGHELALKEAERLNSHYIWLLNPDTEVQANTLENLLKSALKLGDGVYGSLIVNEKNIIQSNFTELSNWNYAEKNIQDVNTEIPEIKLPYINGTSFLIPLSVIEKYGFIDPSYFLYAEEVDYCAQLSRNGISSYLIPNSIIVHQGSSSLKLNPQLKFIKTYYNNRNHILFAKRFGKATNKKITADNNGRIEIILKLIQLFLKYKLLRDNTFADPYYETLGIVHGLMGLRGRYLNPEKFL